MVLLARAIVFRNIEDTMDTETKQTQSWWNKNPFTYNGEKGVGRQSEDVSELTIEYFDTADRKYIKHTEPGTQLKNTPVFSNYIDFESLKGKKVLDIATGTGFATVTFAKFGANVTGIDLTDYAVAQTKRNFELRGLQGEVIRMDAQELDFPDNTFDFVCAHGCLMHMPDTAGAVKEIYRVLKPGGQVYAWMYNKGWYYWFGIMFMRGVLLGKLIKYRFNDLAMTSRYSDGLEDGGNPHTKFYTKKGFENLFKDAGFKDVKVTINHATAEWDTWPTGKVAFGWIVPKSLQKFLSTNLNWGLGASVVGRK